MASLYLGLGLPGCRDRLAFIPQCSSQSSTARHVHMHLVSSLSQAHACMHDMGCPSSPRSFPPCCNGQSEAVLAQDDTPEVEGEGGHHSRQQWGVWIIVMFVVAITVVFEAGNNVMEIVNYSMNVPWHIPQGMADSHTTELDCGWSNHAHAHFDFLARLASYMPLEDKVGSWSSCTDCQSIVGALASKSRVF